MTLQATRSTGDPLSLGEICAEYGKNPTLGFRQCLGLGGTPASGTVGFGAFLGTSSVGTVSIDDQSSTVTVEGGGTAQCTYSLTATGFVEIDTDGGVSTPESWIAPQSGMAGFEARATPTSGSFSGGDGTGWVSLSVSRFWYVLRSGVGGKACTFTMEIRRASDGVVVDSATIQIGANVQP